MGVQREELEKGTRVRQRETRGLAVHWRHGRVVKVHRLMADVIFDGDGSRARPVYLNQLELESARQSVAPAPALALVPAAMGPASTAKAEPIAALEAWLSMGADLRSQLVAEMETLRAEAEAVESETRRLEETRDDLSKRIGALKKQIDRIDAVAPSSSAGLTRTRA